MSVFDAVICPGCQRCIPVHRTNCVNNTRKCVSCSPRDEHDEPMIYCSTPDTPSWVDAIGLVHFDLLQGQTLDVLYPPLPLSSAQETEVSFLCFPDANHVADGDSIHDFVFAYNLSECDGSRLEKSSPEAAKHSDPMPSNGEEVANASISHDPTIKRPYDSTSTELFCSTLFRQRKDSSIQRGAQQKAIIIMSRYPFPNVHHQILKILCAAVYDTAGADGAVIIKSAFEEIRKWPPPLPTNTYKDLRLLEKDLTQFTTPIYTAAEADALRWSETVVHSARADETRRELIRTLEAVDAQWKDVKRALDRFLASAGCSQDLRSEIKKLIDSKSLDQANTAACPRDSLIGLLRLLLLKAKCPSSITTSADEVSDAPQSPRRPNESFSSMPISDEQLDNVLQHFRCRARSPIPPDVARVQNEALEALQCRAHTILASDHVTKAELRATGNGLQGKHLFSEVEFHHALYPHLAKLWKLWELLIIGAPIAVLSFDAPTVSASCLSLASLVAPLRFAGVLRPYVTINNREVDLFVLEKAPPSVLFGTTNPFFVRRCMRWPHFLCLSKESEEAHTHKMLPADSDKREKQQFKLKNRMFCSRHYLVKTEKTIPAIQPPQGKSSFVDLNPQSTEGAPMRQLRQQFYEHTIEFLAPLKEIVRGILRTERPFFLASQRESLLNPEALLKALNQYTGALPSASFKNRADMFAVYKDFVHTNSFRLWFWEQYDCVFRDILLSVQSLEDVLLMDPDPSTRHVVLSILQDEFDRVISQSIVDMPLAQKLSALCSLIPPVRTRLAR